MTLVALLTFIIALNANTNASAVSCSTTVSVDCDGDGDANYIGTTSCEYAAALAQQYIADCP